MSLCFFYHGWQVVYKQKAFVLLGISLLFEVLFLNVFMYLS